MFYEDEVDYPGDEQQNHGEIGHRYMQKADGDGYMIKGQTEEKEVEEDTGVFERDKGHDPEPQNYKKDCENSEHPGWPNLSGEN